MREIKFRAWDKVYEDMYPVVTMDFTEWWVSIGDIGNIHGERHSFKNEETDRFILMQYTGLKDKNGKEIYEGDLLKIPCDVNQERHGNYSIHEVLYRNSTWITSYLKSEKGQILPKGYTGGFLIDHYDPDYKMLTFTDEYLTSDRTEIEVIGNIWEQAEGHRPTE